HIGVLVLAYVLFKLVRQKFDWRKSLIEIAKFSLAGALGAGLAAVQLLPFFEYLSRSQQLLERTGANTHYLPKSLAILNFIPDFFGNQAINAQAYFTTQTNYNESTMGYIGLSFLFLSLVAVLYFYREPLVKFYTVAAALCFAVVYKAPLVYDLVVLLPGFEQGANHRLALFYGFSLIVLGCLALQGMVSSPLSRKRLLSAGLVFLGIFCLSLWPHRNIVLAIIQGGWQNSYPYLWQGRTLLLFALNFSVILAILASRYKYRHVAIVTLVIIETMAHGMIYNTVTRNKDFYPNHPTVSFLTEQYTNNKARVLFVGNIFPPNLGTWYGINQISEYDALGLVSYENYKKTIGDYEGMTEIFKAPLDPTALALGGVKYVVLENDQASLVQSQLKAKTSFQEGNFTVLETETLPRAFVVEANSIDQLKEEINKQARQPAKAIS
ncbi:MAG TPA: hypothetical protein VEA37_08145, partial [Flavobacterium sp.]|nr:hypothetical protein [Flavobacterium sp.]